MDNKLDKLIASGEKLRLSDEQLKELKEINAIVRRYIKEHDLVVYGGMAINEVLKLKGDSIYDADKIPDYDALSADNYRQSIELANILFENGFQFINRVIALHEYSFRVFANLSPDSVADLSYVPAPVLQAIPYFTIDDIRYTAPEYMRIDFYKSFIDVNNLYRWKDKKEYERFLKLEHAYPLQVSKYGSNSSQSVIPNNLFEIFRSFNPIFTGIHTYNKMMHFMGMQEIPLSCLDIYYHNPSLIAKEVRKSGFRIEERNPLIDHLPSSYVVFGNDGKIIGNIYDMNSIYIPNIPVINIDGEQHGTYHFLLLYLYIGLLKYRLIGDADMLALTYYMIYEIQTKRETYLNANSLTGLEIGDEKGSIINIFNLDFDNPPLSFREKMLIRHQFEVSKTYGYKPDKGVKIADSDTDDFKYPKIDYSIIAAVAATEQVGDAAIATTGGAADVPLNATRRDEVIVKYINHLVDYITEKRRVKYEQMFDNKLRPIIESFIKKHRLIITNSIFLQYFDTDYKIKESDYYFEVYGNQKVKDFAREFMDEFANGLAEVEVLYYEIAQVDKYRFNLNLNFKTILSIIKLRDDVFDNIPTFERNGIRILGINMIRLNICNIFANPRQEIAKWKETAKFEEAVDKVFAVEKISCKQKGENKNNKPIINVLKKMDAILVGYAAINAIIGKNIANGNYLSILSDKPVELIGKIKEIVGDGIKHEQKTSYLKLYAKKYIAKLGERKIAEIYDTSDLCLPYITDGNGLKVGTYYTIMKYLYIELVEKKFKHCNEIKELIYLLHKHKSSIKFADIYSIECQGNQRDEIREFKMRKYLGIDPKTGKPFKLAKYS